jgi:hypothetical protein
MARLGESNALTDDELDALRTLVRTVLAAGAAGRTSASKDKSPTQRWEPFAVSVATENLPPKVLHLLVRYGWHRSGYDARSSQAVEDLVVTVAGASKHLDHEQAHQALVAASFWADPPMQSVFSDEKALRAIEDLCTFMTGYVMSLPKVFTSSDHADVINRRFRACQRRHNGTDAPTRTPKAMIRRLPLAAQQLLDDYGYNLTNDAPRTAFALAEITAVALGRPMDPLLVHELDMTFAVAQHWRTLTDFPEPVPGDSIQAMLGERPVDARTWELAATRVREARAMLQSPPRRFDPFFNQPDAQLTVAGVHLNARSLMSLQQIENYVQTFGAWARSGDGKSVDPEDRLAVFDALHEDSVDVNTTGADVVSRLTPDAMKVIANTGSLLERGKNIEHIAVELATALGDKHMAAQCFRTLVASAAWLNGQSTRMERSTSRKDKPQPMDESLLAPFAAASQHEAESLLDLGASISELVRFSRDVDHGSREGDGGAPPGWWLQFHRQEHSTGTPTAATLLARLPDGSRRLLAQQARVLASATSTDITASARVLASALGREGEVVCIRTLAVALAAGVAWTYRKRLSTRGPADTLLGVQPSTPKDRYFCGRAQEQLEWGLQELLHSDTVVGV